MEFLKVIHIKKISYQILFATIFSGCLTPIDIDTQNVGGTLVISGQVSPLQDRSIVQIGTASSEDRLPIPISNILVILIDDLGNEIYYTEDITKPGDYLLKNSKITSDRLYHLEVTFSNGEVYTSTPEVMPNNVGKLTTNFDIVEEEFIDIEGTVRSLEFMKIYSTSQITESNSELYLKWSVDETYLLSPTDFPDPFGSIPPPCFISQNADPQRVILFNRAETPFSQLENQLIASRIIDFSFLEKHYFTSYQSSMSAEAFEYWKKVNILANQVGSIFDTPPAKIIGNIKNTNDASEDVLGYFQVVNESYNRFFTFPYLLPIELKIKKCDFTGSFDERDYPSRCIDCLTVRNSSYSRPDWF